MRTLKLVFGILLFTNFHVFLSCAKSKQRPGVGSSEQKEIHYQVRIRKTVSGSWKNLSVERAKVNNNNRLGYCNFVTFDDDFMAPIEIEVTPLHKPLGSARIRPSSYEIPLSTEEGSIRFLLNKPTKLSLEIDENIVENLFVFANPEITEMPDSTDVQVIYFGPGVHTPGEIVLKDNQTLYIAEGATVYGHVLAKNAQHVRILGRGILDGALLEHRLEKPRVYFIHLENCKDVLVDGITIRDAPGWGCVTWGSSDIVFRNIKQISYNYNSDGFDICHSQNVLIEDVFVRNWDDNISVKSFTGSEVSQVTMRNSTLWADNAHNMLVGPELRGGIATAIRFENIDVLENTQNDDVFPGVMSIMAADGGTYENITFENIRIEDISAGKVICLQYTDAYSDFGKGKFVENVVFKNIAYNGDRASKSRIFGLDENRRIDNILIENYFINGQKATDPVSGNLELNPYIIGLTFK